MANISLAAKARESVGKNKVDKLRAAGEIPAVVYRKGQDTENITVNAHALERILENEGTTSLVDLVFEDGSRRTVLIQDVQKHSYRNVILHVDFHAVRMDEKIRVTVPVVLHNRDSIILQPSVLNQMLDDVEIECLPGDIPAAAEINVEDMQYGDVFYVKDLDVAKDEKLTLHTDLEEPVCSLSEPFEGEEEEAEAEVDAADVPEIGKEDEE